MIISLHNTSLIHHGAKKKKKRPKKEIIIPERKGLPNLCFKMIFALLQHKFSTLFIIVILLLLFSFLGKHKFLIYQTKYCKEKLAAPSTLREYY